MLTYTRLRELFDYVDGKLLCRSKTSRCNQGDEAGTIRKDGRRQIYVDGRSYLASRLVWAWHGRVLPKFLDHRDRNKANDRVDNLRPCTQAENNWNANMGRRNTSGIKGVCWDKRRGKWIAHLSVNYRNHFFGYYDDIELAELVIAEARNKYHGAFAAS